MHVRLVIDIKQQQHKGQIQECRCLVILLHESVLEHVENQYRGTLPQRCPNALIRHITVCGCFLSPVTCLQSSNFISTPAVKVWAHIKLTGKTM